MPRPTPEPDPPLVGAEGRSSRRPSAHELSLLAWPFVGLLAISCPFPVLAGVVVLSVLVPSWRAIRRTGFVPRESPGGSPWVVALVLAVAAAMRGYGLDDFPVAINHDEGMFAFIARDLADRPWCAYSPLLGFGSETGMYYLIQASLHVFGVRPWALHLPGVIASVAGLAAMHALAARVFGPRVAIAALVFAAVAPVPNALARLSHQTNLVPLVSCLGYWALVVALERGGRVRYALAGFVLGLAWHTFHGYRANALAGPALALLAMWRLRGADAPRGLPGGLPWLAAGYALPFAVVVRQLATHPAMWLAPLAQHAFGGAGPTPGSIGLVVSTALVDVPTGGVVGLFPASLLVVAALPLAFLTRDRRGLLLAWMLVTHLAPLGGTASDAAARHRYATMVPVLAILAGCAWTSIEMALAGGWRTAWRVGALALTLGMASASGHQLLQHPGERDPNRREMAVLRAVLARVRDGGVQAYFPEGYHGYGHFAVRFFFLDPRIRVLPGNDPRAVDLTADALFITGAGLREPDVLEAFPRAQRIMLDLPYPVPSPTQTAWFVSRRDLAAERAPIGPAGWLWIPRDGRYSISAPPAARGALFLDDRLALRADVEGARSELALARGVVPYRREGKWPSSPPWELVGPILAPPMAFTLPEPPLALPALAAVGMARAGGAKVRGGWARPASFALAHLGSRHLDLGSPELHDVARGAGDRMYVALLDRVVALDAQGVVDPGFALDDSVAPFAAAPTSLAVSSREWSLDATADGRLLVSAWQRRWVGIVDGVSGTVLARLECPDGWREPTDVAVAPDGRMAVADRGWNRVVVLSAAGTYEGGIGVERPESVCWLGESLVVLAGGRNALIRLRAGRVVAERSLGAIGPSARIQRVASVVAYTSSTELRFYDQDLELLEVGGYPVIYPPAGPSSAGNVTGLAWDARADALWLVSESSQLVHYAVRD